MKYKSIFILLFSIIFLTNCNKDVLYTYEISNITWLEGNDIDKDDDGYFVNKQLSFKVTMLNSVLEQNLNYQMVLIVLCLSYIKMI